MASWGSDGQTSVKIRQSPMNQQGTYQKGLGLRLVVNSGYICKPINHQPPQSERRRSISASITSRMVVILFLLMVLIAFQLAISLYRRIGGSNNHTEDSLRHGHNLENSLSPRSLSTTIAVLLRDEGLAAETYGLKARDINARKRMKTFLLFIEDVTTNLFNVSSYVAIDSPAIRELCKSNTATPLTRDECEQKLITRATAFVHVCFGFVCVGILGVIGMVCLTHLRRIRIRKMDEARIEAARERRLIAEQKARYFESGSDEEEIGLHGVGRCAYIEDEMTTMLPVRYNEAKNWWSAAFDYIRPQWSSPSEEAEAFFQGRTRQQLRPYLNRLLEYSPTPQDFQHFYYESTLGNPLTLRIIRRTVTTPKDWDLESVVVGLQTIPEAAFEAGRKLTAVEQTSLNARGKEAITSIEIKELQHSCKATGYDVSADRPGLSDADFWPRWDVELRPGMMFDGCDDIE